MEDKPRPNPTFPNLSPGQITLLRGTFLLVERQSAIAALVFYRHLFNLDPSLQALFHTSIELQGRKLMDALEFTLATLDNPAELVPVLEAMGRRHVTYGTKDEHYSTMRQAMLLTLGETLGEDYTPEAEAAWAIALDFINQAMIRGAGDVQELLRGGSVRNSGD